MSSLGARGVSDKPYVAIYHSSLEIFGFTEKIQLSGAIRFVWLRFHWSGLAGAYLPTGSVTEYNEALLISPFYEGHTGVLLPVSHGLLENGPLASWNDRAGLITVLMGSLPPSEAIHHADSQRRFFQWELVPQTRNALGIRISLAKNINFLNCQNSGRKSSWREKRIKVDFQTIPDSPAFPLNGGYLHLNLKQKSLPRLFNWKI